MRSIEKLEFLPRKSPPMLGALLLLLAIICLGWEFFHLRQANSLQSEVLQQTNTTTSKASARPSTGGSPEAARSLAVAVATSRQLATPWAGLLQSLESAATRDVALLKIEPNALEGQLRITGEARNTAAVLNYVQKVQSTTALAELVLQSHQLANEKPGSPTRFVLSGTWGSKAVPPKKPGV
jgi:Fimbrial assembly protein (PilN)